MNDATTAQNNAARPDVSTWLTANAGSGKTRVLINRVARLLLNGVQPESILCLTYTTAAASEMQNRLFQTLGSWAMLSDTALADGLISLGEAPPFDLAQARTLFARAIETPGGLKIQTIHSFCSKVLRQFPLEAGVNPQFRELDEASQSQIVTEVIEALAESHPETLIGIHRFYAGQDLVALGKDVARHSPGFSKALSRPDVLNAFGLRDDTSLEAIVAAAVQKEDIAFLRSLIPVLQELGSTNDQKLAASLSKLSDDPWPRDLLLLEDCLLTKGQSAQPFSLSPNVPTKKVKTDAAFAPLLARYVEIGERVERARRDRIALECAEQTLALHGFASVFLAEYQNFKARLRVLDFDDLIRLTCTLLTSRSLAWVLYRLDSRIDHVLVDEAQDTSPAQWDIIGALTGEMVSTANDRPRTLFVVGDKKQSIYSFQGADAAGFDAREQRFSDQLAHTSGLARGELLHSFRSSSAILDAVDAVFSGEDGTGDPTRHRAFYEDMPGRVDVWPLVAPAEQQQELAWYDTSDRNISNDATLQLANCIACYVSELLEKGTIQGENGTWRRIRPGDIMILVQRRSALFDKIIAACKSRDIAIAGADRLKIGAELAVRDILALLSFLALPEDDLSLAAALKSPLFGWTESDLFDLAANRTQKQYLWQALRDRAEDFPRTYEILSELRNRTDFERPFELIHTILTKLHGRQHLLERLGQEAEDGVDELMNQALSYEQSNVPTLTGFLSSVRASDIEVKRETERTGDLLRVMTVHGAKGLESPIVILPDTTVGPPQASQSIIAGPKGILTLARSRDKSTDELQAKNAEIRAAEEAERDRLLYVAMTRAERWLIVTGVEPARGSKNRLNWHGKIADGLTSLETESIETPTGQGVRFAQGAWENAEVRHAAETSSHESLAPETKLGPVSAPQRKTARSPSDLGGAKAMPGEAAVQHGGLRKGRQMHLLLEHLPKGGDRKTRATGLLNEGPDAATDEEIKELVAEASQIIETHEEIFGPNSYAEVEIAGTPPSLGQKVFGAIDRVYVAESRVLAVDFKTNAVVPQRAEDTPEGILRQMGAYLEVLEKIYPNRTVETAILWTTNGFLMPLKHAIVRDALKRATTS